MLFRSIELTLFVAGLGVGATVMPTMSAALSTLKRDEVARATSGLNVLLRLGGSVGTALAAVLLTSQLSTRLPSGGDEASALSTARSLSPAARSLMLQGLAEAFSHTFVWGFVVLLLAIFTVSFLPRKKVELTPSSSAPKGMD